MSLTKPSTETEQDHMAELRRRPSPIAAIRAAAI
jgi:hypothetical protein